MFKTKSHTAAIPSTHMPKGIPYIISNEAAERFSFYGMKGILTIFMVRYLMGQDGQLAVMRDEEAKFWVHIFVTAVYFTPIVGAIISDAFFGKYRTIISLSIVYCFGHLALALDDTRIGLFAGLALIAIGSGGIKPCVSAHVGDQFGKTNAHLLTKVFGWFYFSINFGSCLSTILMPILLDKYGPKVAFAVPGIFMFLATLAFWLGRWKFVHIPPGGMGFVKETFSGEGFKAIRKLIVIFVFVAMFWALFDQTASAWVLQADKMDRSSVLAQRLLEIGWLKKGEWLPSQIQAINPFLIMIMIPLFSYLIYPAINKVFKLTPLRKISIGLFVAAASFVVPALVETWISSGARPSYWWQILAYVILTAAEVMVSITALEFSYTQAPKKMKSFIMALFLMSVSLGNAFTAGVNKFIQNQDGTSKLAGASYYWFFTAAMLLTAIIFIAVVMT
ncbi:MAG: POT family MFS transporter, partial [Planctomycetota bacterium]